VTDGVGDSGIPPFVADSARFASLLTEHLAARKTDGLSLAVLVIECGFVGSIDATWGYHIGDAVRQRIASLLCTDVLRPGDFVGEIGRDELACVLSTVDGLAVAELAASKSLRALASPFWVGEEEIYATPAVGIALFPLHGERTETLLQRSRNACSAARERPGRIAGYDAEYDMVAETRLVARHRLRSAVAENQVALLFQPQYDLRLGQVMGAEALLCRADASAGIIEPEQAFAAAETLDQVSELLSSILNQALRNVSEFRYSAGLDLRIGVRLPGTALRHPELVDVVQRALGTWSRRPGTLILGISQTSALLSDEQARSTLVKIKEIGVKLAIDDPFTRISSLFQLAELPFQEMRLDVSGAADSETAPKSERILKAVIDLAHQLRLSVLAAGVPGEAAAARLKTLGCDYMQADFRAPAADPQSFVERYGFSED